MKLERLEVMVMHHIGLTYDLEQSIKLYSIDNKISFSEAVRRLLSVGLNRNLNIMNYDLLDKKINTIISKQKYIITLIEQFYADMEIEDLQDPKMNEALQKFKNQKLKDYFND